MKLEPKLKPFLKEETGAVSVEWVFLTAAFVALTLLTISTMKTATLESTTATTTRMSTLGPVD